MKTHLPIAIAVLAFFSVFAADHAMREAAAKECARASGQTDTEVEACFERFGL